MTFCSKKLMTSGQISKNCQSVTQGSTTSTSGQTLRWFCCSFYYYKISFYFDVLLLATFSFWIHVHIVSYCIVSESWICTSHCTYSSLKSHWPTWISRC